MTGVLTEDAKVLIPNAGHKNFVATNEVIEKGTVVEGTIRYINGLRRGEPFTYKLFFTNNNQYIYLKPIKMDNTEVTLGADGQPATKVDLIPSEMYSKLKIALTLTGVAIGLYMGKKKGLTGTQLIKPVAIGGLLGYTAAYFLDKNKKATVSKVNMPK